MGPAGPQGEVGPQGPAGNNASGTALNTPDAIVQRDANGAFAAGNITLTGLTVSTNGIVSSGTYGAGTLAPVGTGVRMLWYPRKAAFRAGQLDVGGTGTEWNDANIGNNSVAMGTNTLASGMGSFAVGSFAEATGTVAISMGLGSIASGGRAIAMGQQPVASGDDAIAIGFGARATAQGATAIGFADTASGVAAVAMGAGSIASGATATALGAQVRATGDYSVAIGNLANTNGQSGAIVIGDRSTTSQVVASAPNQFVVRANGGYVLYSDAAMTTGATLTTGSGSWASVSDRNRKQDFRALNGDQVLARIRTMPIEEWSYISEGNEIRHVGPTAQDFRAAFGLGVNDRTITSVDIDGINLFAIQQLIERQEALKAENAALRSEVNDLKARLERLERLIDKQ